MKEHSTKEIFWFHSLDALRFFAFFKVFLFHIPVEGDFPVFRYINYGGGIGVSFFFVLSGFLITYLLVKEKVSNGKILAKRFFVRRALRIWPLYFLIVILVFLIPYETRSIMGTIMVEAGYEPDWRFSFTFLENYKMMLEDQLPNTAPLPAFWSICVEEHFYILWVILLWIMPVKYFKTVLLLGIPIAVVSRYVQPLIFHNELIHEDFFTNMDYFTSGGCLGYFVGINRKKALDSIGRIPVLVRCFAVVTMVIIVVFQKNFYPQHHTTLFTLFWPTFVAIVFTFGIAAFLPVNGPVKINNRILNYLGRISYGLYVYHLVVIYVFLNLYSLFEVNLDDYLTIGFFILITFLVSVLISHISYHYFERQFLDLRSRISK